MFLVLVSISWQLLYGDNHVKLIHERTISQGRFIKYGLLAKQTIYEDSFS